MRKFLLVLEMIKFEHTIFALPFAFLGAFLAARGFPGWGTSGWILLAMVGARSAAMAFNRLADQPFDVLNPRTRDRALPSGRVDRSFVVLFVIASSALFFFSAWMLNPLAFRLSPLALAIVLLYSFSKRFTWFSHLWLGLSLSIAPVGGWIAVRGRLEGDSLYLAAAVLFWVGGFDIIYACQDVDFDRRVGLHSLPGRFGARAALWVALFFHAAMVFFLTVALSVFDLTMMSWVGLGLVVGTLIYEHQLVRPDDLSRANVAFFALNGVVSIVLLVFVGLDLCLLV